MMLRSRVGVGTAAFAALVMSLGTAAPASATALSSLPSGVRDAAVVETTDAKKATVYFRWGSNGQEIFARTPDGKTKRLSYAQWVAAGKPKPESRSSGFYRAPWSDVIHVVNAKGEVRRISYSEWLSYGAPTPALAPVEYVKTPWAPQVFAFLAWPTGPNDRKTDLIVPLNYAEWSRAGKPGVKERLRIPGDSIVKYTVGDTVFHSVAGVLTPLSGAQWDRLGRPQPTVQAAPSPTYIRGILIVNKSLPIPSNYGNGLTAETTSAFDRMRADAARSGLSLRNASGFRSFDSQTAIFNARVARNGRAAAEQVSARPGHSEHQTGLALDLNSISASFANTAEGRWVDANAHKYGFIIRYPKGKEHITGYVYEPWHIRYVGVEAATTMKRNGWTLEEYLGVPSRY